MKKKDKVFVPKDFTPKDTKIYKSTIYHKKFNPHEDYKIDKSPEEIQETRNKYAELSKLLSLKVLKT